LEAVSVDSSAGAESTTSGRKRKGEDIDTAGNDGPQLISLSGVDSFIPENLQGYLNGIGLACLDFANSAFQYHDCGSNQVTKEILVDTNKERIYVHQGANTLAHVRFVKRPWSFMLDIWNMSTNSKLTSKGSMYKECMLFVSTDGSRILNWYITSNGKYRIAMLDTANAEQIWNLEAPSQLWCSFSPDAIKFSADSQHYLILDKFSGHVIVFCSVSGNAVSEMKDICVRRIAVNEFGRLNVCAVADRTGGTHIRDFITNEQKCLIDTGGGLQFVHEDRLASIMHFAIEVWDINAANMLFKYCYSTFASLIASAGNETMITKTSRLDGEELKDTLHILNSVTGEYLGAIESTAPVCGIYCGQPLTILL
jgi:hypothetical protein